MADNIRIKDIATTARVSVGTVDRVLHNRPNVSKSAREKVEAALKEMNYQPNMYASALAYNRNYTFYLFMPDHASETYWEEIEKGAEKEVELRRDFHIHLKIVHYDRTDPNSYTQKAKTCLEANPDGMIVVPITLEITRQLTDQLHSRQLPFILLDSYMPDLKPLAFFGQDSFCSGYFAAKMFMLIASKEKQIMLMKLTKNGALTSKQQSNREVGFRHYMTDHFPDIEIVVFDMPLEATKKEYDTLLEQFFKDHPDIHHCITMNSKAHIIGEFLLRANKRDVQIMGYDMVEKNAECLRKGSISFLIAQHAFMQGYSSMETLFKAIVLKKKVDPVNYMPIELLSKENVDFYRRKQL